MIVTDYTSHHSSNRVTLRDLVILSYNNGFTLWHYRPSMTQGILSVCSPEFWSDADVMINEGDIIEVSNAKFALRLFKSRDGIEAI